MSARIRPGRVWRAVLPVAAGALLAGMSAGSMLAQQAEAANTGAAAHTAPSGENKGGRFQAPRLKAAPAKEPSRGGANAVDHNAIGITVVRPDAQKPTGPNLDRAATPAPPVPPGRAASLGITASPAPHIFTPAPRPPLSSHGAINGAAFARPSTTLAPLGGPAKHAAVGINGTSIQPKH